MISFPGLLRWFSSPSVTSVPYFIQVSDDGIASVGLPHSAIQGSQDMCSSPWLIAAYHGLLRLAAPRHPPYTYYSLDHIIVSSSYSYRSSRAVQAFQVRSATSKSIAYLWFSRFVRSNQFPGYSITRKRIFRLRIPSLFEISVKLSLPQKICVLSKNLENLPREACQILWQNCKAILHRCCGLKKSSSRTILQRACAPAELGLIRVELMTPSLSEKCSNRLSYRPV